MPSKHDHNKKHSHQVPASQANIQQIQELLGRYQFIAAALDTNTEAAQDEETLAPITSLDENTQLALVKELGKELTMDAANVLQAIYTYAPAKEVRKEARRSLVRLEASDLYPEWEPPTVTLFDSMAKELLSTSDGDDEIEESGLLSELESQLASLMPVSPAELTISSYLQAWAAGDYGSVYDHLTTSSPLREGLEHDAWIERREQWQQTAQPQTMRIQFIRSVEDDPEVVDAGWSLAFTDTDLSPSLPELPIATIVYPETGRRWFWARYRVVENQYIQEMSDEGAKALTLSEEELTERLQEATEIANERLQELQEEGEDLDEEDEDEDFVDSDIVDEEDEEDEDLDEEEDFDEENEEDEDFDEDEEDLDIEEMMDRVQEAFGITSTALSYTDALIARTNETDPTIYETAHSLASAMMDHERAAAYMSMMAEKLPDKRGEALTELASSLSLIANQYDEEDDAEQTGHFLNLAEKNLREAITLANEPRSKVLLAQVLLAQNKQFEEAETLLKEAKSVELEPRLETLADVSLARLAQERGENKQALNYYMEAAAIHPDFPNLWFYIGQLQAELGQIDDAEQSLLRNIEQEPETVDAYLELANIYNINKQDPEKAEFIIAQGLEAIPDSADLLTAQAIFLINKGDLVQAEQFLDEAEEIDPEVEMLQEARTLLQLSRQQSQSKRAKPKQRNKRKR